MKDLAKEFLEKEIFSYIDLFFAEKLLENNSLKDSFFSLSYLFNISRLGHLCLKVDFEKKRIFPKLFSVNEEKVIEGLLKIPNSILSKKENSKEFFQKPIFFSKNSFYLQRNYFFEKKIAKNLKKFLKPFSQKELFNEKKIKEEIEEDFLLKKLTFCQKKALLGVLEKKIFFIFGGPGTGKSFAATCLVELIARNLKIKKEKTPFKIIITAPTGKASLDLEKKILEKLQKKEDSSKKQKNSFFSIRGVTLHLLLKEGFERKDFINADLIIVDEASMIDTRIMAFLFEKVHEKTRLVLIGDPNQLPPVESKNIFSVFSSSKFSKFSIELEKNKRFETEEIFAIATLLKEKKNLEFLKILEKNSLKDFSFLEPSKEKSFKKSLKKKLIQYVDENFLPSSFCSSYKKAFEGFSKFRILSATKKSFLGFEGINNFIFNYLTEEAFKKFSENSNFFIPIIITKNDYNLNLFNGTLGIISKKKYQEEVVFFKDEKKSFRKIPLFIIPNFSYAYCLSVHKSQGSEFEKVFLILSEKSKIFGKELLYTAITRARKKIEIFAKKETIYNMLTLDEKIETNLLNRLEF